MGHQFTIESDEAFALATELAAMTGSTVANAVADALRVRVAAERARLAELARMKAAVSEFHKVLRASGDGPLSSDHSWLYDDETGLPV